MHGVGAGDLAGGDDLVDVEIAVARGGRADADAFVGKSHMHGVRVGRGMHHDGLDPQFLAARRTRSAISPRFAMRIFWNIGGAVLKLFDHDQRHAVFHRLGILDEERLDGAGPGDGIWFMVFIASMMRRV